MGFIRRRRRLSFPHFDLWRKCGGCAPPRDALPPPQRAEPNERTLRNCQPQVECKEEVKEGEGARRAAARQCLRNE